MKYLGIDYGSKRIGVAISDEDGKMAFPFSVIENSDNSIQDVISICSEKKIENIIIGESKNFQMHDNNIMKEARLFAEELSEKGFHIEFYPEFMTSVQAERFQGKNDMLDASAAAIILSSYLDSLNNKN